MSFCSGQIKGDPDIAGIGVVFAIFINAALAIALSTVLWVYIFVYPRSNDLDPSKAYPWWVRVLRDTMIMQGDSQLISGLAIIIASLINMRKDEDTPLYHMFIARALADVCLTGHAAAIIIVYPTRHNWTFRLILVFVAVVLWEYWSWLAIDRFRRWKWQTPHCFENTNIIPGEYESWIIFSLVWMPLGYGTLYLSLWKSGRELTDIFEAGVVGFPRFVARRFRKTYESWLYPRFRFSVTEILKKSFYAAVSLVGCIVFLVFAILIPTSRTLSPLQSAIFLWWDVYDVDRARKANAHIVVANPEYRSGKSFQNNDNPEHDWGFGQILPLVMLLFPILSALDMINGAYTEHQDGRDRPVTHQGVRVTIGHQTHQGVTRQRTVL